MHARLRSAWERTPLPPQTLAGIAAALLAQYVRPLRLPAWTQQTGWAVACGGLALATAAARERGPGSLEQPMFLATRGVHGHSRNPMYLALTILQVGLAGGTRNAWMLASAPVSAALLHQAILREESWLQKRFGAEYETYSADIPRYW